MPFATCDITVKACTYGTLAVIPAWLLLHAWAAVMPGSIHFCKVMAAVATLHMLRSPTLPRPKGMLVQACVSLAALAGTCGHSCVLIIHP